MKQLELFSIPQDTRNADLRSFIKHNWAGKFNLADLKTIFALAEQFDVIEGRVLAIFEEEKALGLKKKASWHDDCDDEANRRDGADDDYDEEYEEDGDDDNVFEKNIADGEKVCIGEK